MTPRPAARSGAAAIARLDALTPLDGAALRALQLATELPRRFRARGEVVAEHQELRGPMLILKGWAACVRGLADGRRQIVHLLLPGDLIGWYEHDRPLAGTAVVALTDLETCAAPDPTISPALQQAYMVSRAHEQAYLFGQITRLGRMNAQERIADLALELLERLALAGLASGNGFSIPLTQEIIADTLGLTSVHVNRMLQVMRKDGELVWSGRELTLPEPARLRRSVGRAEMRVSADRP